MDRPDLLPFTESDEANRLLASDGFALLMGMLLDQQFPMERAFYGPQLLKDRLGGELTPEVVASTPLEDLEAVFRGPPAIHRYPASMAKRTQELARVVIDDYDGAAENLWESANDGSELLSRLRALPGFGAEKSRIFVGLLGKRLGVRPEGWEEKAADWPSIADVANFEDVLALREKKKAMKAAKRA
ncbi:MAG TPA: HhH-GPD-type base excision DNA repair protein [Acidimicrobiia bacterium]|nr:HhH-GPD-type base excision DNA repair protein [Acidimicrobiia bacterium]